MSHSEKQHQAPAAQEKSSSESGGISAKAPAFKLSASNETMQQKQAAQMQSERSPAQIVAAYIAQEMRTNAGTDVVARIRANWESWNPSRKFDALTEWRDQVNYGAPWDHKGHISSTWGNYQSDPTAGVEWFFDIWSNVHYGYVGRACGFSEWTLLAGAGLAQVRAGTNPDGYWDRRFDEVGDADFLAAFDDPKDQAACRIGFELWNSGTVSETSLLTLMRGRVAELAHR